ncbi:hypothetical protein CJF30_00008136 [Rutstroemia sp. NJR-2017a BBW]|nr:hypothetical protein CJF30_00008136 [Rutstroemia sp. NJR-2017a BBW]
MYISFFLLSTSLTVANLVTSTALPETPPPPGYTYTKGYPLCSIPGFTVVPGKYNETVHQYPNATLASCINECRSAYPACQSIAFHARYTECLWFDKKVERTQLYRDDTSEFVHWDLICPVPAC